MAKIFIKTNFSFAKLVREYPKIMNKHSRRVGRSAEKGAKDAISKGLKPVLEQSTIDIRKKKGTGGSKPLFETGALFNSIKRTDEGLEMLAYGKYHHDGFITKPESMIPNKTVPPRPFIKTDETQVLKSFEAFGKDLRKALKK